MKCIEKKIINYLSNLGISIHIYHAFSTNSIYIKLDYGVLGSIRISDHDGKERYKYKYNVRTDIKEEVKNMQELMQIIGRCWHKNY